MYFHILIVLVVGLEVCEKFLGTNNVTIARFNQHLLLFGKENEKLSSPITQTLL